MDYTKFQQHNTFSGLISEDDFNTCNAPLVSETAYYPPGYYSRKSWYAMCKDRDFAKLEKNRNKYGSPRIIW